MIEVASSLIIFKSLQRLYIAAIICRLTKLRCRAPLVRDQNLYNRIALHAKFDGRPKSPSFYLVN